MSDDQFRALKTLILDQSVKIEALSADIRALKKAVETTDVVFLDDPRMTTDDLLKTLQSREPGSGN